MKHLFWKETFVLKREKSVICFEERAKCFEKINIVLKRTICFVKKHLFWNETFVLKWNISFEMKHFFWNETFVLKWNICFEKKHFFWKECNLFWRKSKVFRKDKHCFEKNHLFWKETFVLHLWATVLYKFMQFFYIYSLHGQSWKVETRKLCSKNG